MNKVNVLHTIIALLEVQYQTAIDAAKEAHSTATDDETIAENKYDTFALEASYLAHGQSQRVIDCENNLRLFKTLPIKQFTERDAINVGALVTLSTATLSTATLSTATLSTATLSAASVSTAHVSTAHVSVVSDEQNTALETPPPQATRHYFIGPSCGGLKVTVAEKDYMVISPQSVLGKTLIGKYIDDEVTIPISGKLTTHEVTKIS